MASERLLLQELNRRAPGKKWRFEGMVGVSIIDYYMFRNRLQPADQKGAIYKVSCRNIEPAFFQGSRIEIQTNERVWQIPKRALDTNLDEVVRQLISEARGYMVKSNRVIY